MLLTFLFICRDKGFPRIVAGRVSFPIQCLCERHIFKSSHTSPNLFCILRLFSSQSFAGWLGHHTCLCTVSQSLLEASNNQELSVGSEDAAHFSWISGYLFRWFHAGAWTEGYMQIASACSYSSQASYTWHSFGFSQHDESLGFSSLLCVGVQSVFVLHLV